jgi:hypothetical protein
MSHMSMKKPPNKDFVRIKVTPEARQKLRIIAAVRGETMQDAAGLVFDEETQRIMEQPKTQ